ncbi:MAG: DUF4249 family protein [Marinoscillum sp.]
MPLKVNISVGCLVIAFLSACVEPISFELPNASEQIVIEGIITDQPGPYEVKISKGIDLNSDTLRVSPVTGASVVLHNDQGESEEFEETGPGIYQTSGIIQGEVGHLYHITLETTEGHQYQSEPDILEPVGEILGIDIEFESRTVLADFGEVQADVLKVFVDADGAGQSYTRWKFTGIFRIETFPGEHVTDNPPYTPFKDPFPCSGYIVSESDLWEGGKLVKVGDCECCECWVYVYEQKPQLSTSQLVKDGLYRHVKVGEIGITSQAFHDKYLIEIEQMSLSKTAYDFFNLIKAQKEGADNIFQPSFGEIIGNVKASNPNNPVVGLFWATSISTSHRFVSQEDLPYPVPQFPYITLPSADVYPNSTYEQPELWED